MTRNARVATRSAPETRMGARDRGRGGGNFAPIAARAGNNRPGALPRGASAPGPGRFTPFSEVDGDS